MTKNSCVVDKSGAAWVVAIICAWNMYCTNPSGCVVQEEGHEWSIVVKT